MIEKSGGKNPWYTLKADDGNRIIKFRKHELRLLKSQISPRRRQPKRGAQTQAAGSDSEEKEEDDAVAWLDVALRARLPGVPGFCEGKVIEHQEQETYLVEWSYPNPPGERRAGHIPTVSGRARDAQVEEAAGVSAQPKAAPPAPKPSSHSSLGLNPTPSHAAPNTKSPL